MKEMQENNHFREMWSYFFTDMNINYVLCFISENNMHVFNTIKAYFQFNYQIHLNFYNLKFEYCINLTTSNS